MPSVFVSKVILLTSGHTLLSFVCCAQKSKMACASGKTTKLESKFENKYHSNFGVLASMGMRAFSQQFSWVSTHSLSLWMQFHFHIDTNGKKGGNVSQFRHRSLSFLTFRSFIEIATHRLHFSIVKCNSLKFLPGNKQRFVFFSFFPSFFCAGVDLQLQSPAATSYRLIEN